MFLWIDLSALLLQMYLLRGCYLPGDEARGNGCLKEDVVGDSADGFEDAIACGTSWSDSRD